MSPTMVFRRSDKQSQASLGELLLVLGGSGGPKIITAVVQVFLNHLLLGMPLFESTIRPRVHNQLIYNGAAVTAIEDSKLRTGESISVPDRTISALESRHHDLLKVGYLATVQAVAVDLETNTMR